MSVQEGKGQLDKRNILSVLQFTTRILLPKYPYSVFPILTTLYIAHKNREKRRQRLQLKCLPADIHSKLIPETVKRSYIGNIESCVLVNFNVLEAFEISTCSWQKLYKAHHKEITDAQIETTSYLVHVVAVPDIEDSTAFVTNVMYYNISATLQVDSKIGYVSFEASTNVCKNKSLSFIPHIASKVVVSLINTPATTSSDIVDVILTHYLEKPRYFCQGDIFEINVTLDAPDVYFSNYELKFLYFKIVEITGPNYENADWKDTTFGFYVVKDLTTVVQVTNQQGYLPRREYLTVVVDEHFTATNYKSLMLNMCPFGLDSHCKELIRCIKPFKTKARKDAFLRPLILLSGPRGAGKCKICNCSAQMLGMNIWMVDSLEQQGNTPGFTEGKLKFIFGKATQYAPCIVVLKNIEALCKDRTESRVISSFADEIQKLMQELRMKQYPVVVVATTNTKNETSEPLLPPALGRLFLHTIHLSSPSENERKMMLDWILKRNGIKVDCDFTLSHTAARSSGFLYEDLKALVSQAIKVKYKQLRNTLEEQTNVQKCLSKEDFGEALDVMHAAYSDAIGAPKIPKVTWNDIGGLENLKGEIMKTVMMPLQYPELAASGLRRSGILLYGPPGTGKTLLAKAVATECNLNFLSVKGPELLNIYVGQSEENVREVFGRARAASPCIIFFDELDSLAPNRGRTGDSGGVMDRVVSQLLAEMDGLQKSTHLFVIGATNRPDLIDPALLRPGRFDKLLYVGMCEDNQSKLNVLTALTRRFHLHKNVNLEQITSKFPDMLTGADIYSICSGAWLSAVRKHIHHLEKYGSDNTGDPVEVTEEDFEKALQNFTPSVSTEDLLYFKQLQNEFTGR